MTIIVIDHDDYYPVLMTFQCIEAKNIKLIYKCRAKTVARNVVVNHKWHFCRCKSLEGKISVEINE